MSNEQSANTQESTPETSATAEPKPSKFWDTYERELVVSVKKQPSDYALAEGETPEDYAKRTRAKMQAKGMTKVNHTTPTFRRLAIRLGIRHNREALIQAEKHFANQANQTE